MSKLRRDLWRKRLDNAWDISNNLHELEVSVQDSHFLVESEAEKIAKEMQECITKMHILVNSLEIALMGEMPLIEGQEKEGETK